MVSKDTAAVNAFLSEFVDDTTKKFPGKVDFILLVGSAALGEFRAGESDVDMLVQLKNSSDVPGVLEYASQLVFRLNKKHNLQLYKAKAQKKKTVLLPFFLTKPKAGKKPKHRRLFVIGPGEVKWEEGRLPSNQDLFGILDCIHQQSREVMKHIKVVGKVLYGRDVLKEIGSGESTVDKIKSTLISYGFLTSLTALSASILMSPKGLKRATKLLIYSVDHHLYLVNKSDGNFTSYEELLGAAEENGYFGWLSRKAIFIARNPEKVKEQWSYLDRVAFCFQASLQIFINNMIALSYLLKHYYLKR